MKVVEKCPAETDFAGHDLQIRRYLHDLRAFNIEDDSEDGG